MTKHARTPSVKKYQKDMKMQKSSQDFMNRSPTNEDVDIIHPFENLAMKDKYKQSICDRSTDLPSGGEQLMKERKSFKQGPSGYHSHSMPEGQTDVNTADKEQSQGEVLVTKSMNKYNDKVVRHTVKF